MAVAAVVPLLEAAVANAPQILAAANMASELASKFGPKVLGAVNHLHHLGRKKKSAFSYLKKLGTPKGLKKFITRDLGKAIAGGGKVIAHVGSYGNQISNITGQGSQGGAVRTHAHKIAQAINVGAKHATRYHQIAEHYHTQAESMVSPLKAYRF